MLLGVWQHLLDQSFIRLVDIGWLTQVAHALGGLLGQYMATMRLVTLELASGSPGKPFGRATVGFQFGHNNVPR